MPILLDISHAEERATTNPVMAAIADFWGWILFGPRQHDRDLRWSLGPVPRESVSEAAREGSASK